MCRGPQGLFRHQSLVAIFFHVPIIAAIQTLRPASHDEVPFSYDLSVSAYPRPPASRCVSRVSAVGPVAELNVHEMGWRSSKLATQEPAVVPASLTRCSKGTAA